LSVTVVFTMPDRQAGHWAAGRWAS
jgi:hypothetical protein